MCLLPPKTKKCNFHTHREPCRLSPKPSTSCKHKNTHPRSSIPSFSSFASDERDVQRMKNRAHDIVLADVEAVGNLRGKLGGNGGSGGDGKGVEDAVREALEKAEKERERERKEKESEQRVKKLEERFEGERKEREERKKKRDKEQKERARELERKEREERERRETEKRNSDYQAMLKILQEQQKRQEQEQRKQDIQEGVRREFERMSGVGFITQNVVGYGGYGVFGAWNNGLMAPQRQELLAAPAERTDPRLSRLEVRLKEDELDRLREREIERENDRIRRLTRWS